MLNDRPTSIFSVNHNFHPLGSVSDSLGKEFSFHVNENMFLANKDFFWFEFHFFAVKRCT